MSGKGDKQRIPQVSLKKFEANWNKIFTNKTSTELVKARLNTELEQNSLVGVKAADTKKQ